MIERRIPPAGDPFIGASFAGQREVPDHEAKPSEAGGAASEATHACLDGWVYLGFEREVDGELVEITDRVPCRRCNR